MLVRTLSRCSLVAALSAAGCKTSPVAGVAPCDASPAAQSPLRRLTNAQYMATLRDLFRLPDGDVLSMLREQGPLDEDVSDVWLPGERRVHGYAGQALGQTPSPFLIERLNDNAIQVAAAAVARSESLFGCGQGSCRADALQRLAYRAWRRPLTEAEATDLATQHRDLASQHGEQTAFQLGIQAILMAPEFLYLPEMSATDTEVASCASRVPLDDFEMATRLSYLLWNTTPSDGLLSVAAQGGLSTPDHVQQIALDMMRLPEFDRGLRAFHEEWLSLNEVAGFAREAPVTGLFVDEYHPGLMAEQAHRFVIQTVRGDTPTLRTLLTGTDFPMHGEIAQFYDVPTDGFRPPGDPDSESFTIDDVWQNIPVDPTKRAGVFTMAGPMAAHATYTKSSPVLRGVYVMDRLLCAEAPPPPGDINTNVDEGSSSGSTPTTNRQRYAAHTDNAACRSCHESIDSVGFAFENYNATGSWWDREPWTQGVDWEEDPSGVTWLDVDASGTLGSNLLPADLAGYAYTDAVEMMTMFAERASVHDCYAQHFYRYALGRPLVHGPADAPTVDDVRLRALSDRFYQHDGSIVSLVLDLVGSEAFTTRVEVTR